MPVPAGWGAQTPRLPPRSCNRKFRSWQSLTETSQESYSRVLGLMGFPVSLLERRGASMSCGEPGEAPLGQTVTLGALCLLIRDVAHGILNKAYRKLLDQLSARNYLQMLVAKGMG